MVETGLILPPERGLFCLDEPVLGPDVGDKARAVLHGGMWPSQRLWWEADNFVKMFVGGYGAGKTLMLCKRGVRNALLNAPVPCALVSPTYPMARQTIVPTLVGILDSMHAWCKYWLRKGIRKSSLTYKQRQSAPYEFFITYKQEGFVTRKGHILIYSGEHPQRLKGPNLATAGIDEPFIQPYEVFEQMSVRCRHPKARLLEVGMTGCVTRDTWVVTPDGLKPIGNLDPGSLPKEYVDTLDTKVMGVHGKWYDSTKFYNNGVDEVVTVTLATGQKITATPDHPVMIMGADGKYEFKRIGDRKGKYAHLDQLSLDDHVAVARGMDCWGDQDPCAGWVAPESRRKADMPGGFGVEMTGDLAYFFGLWIAEGSYDGSQERVTITCGDQEPHAALRKGLLGWKFVQASPGRLDQSRIYSEQLVSLMRHIGMPLVKAPKKWVPDWVFQGKREWALAFLAGLIDGDGHVTANGMKVIGYTSTSKLLIEGVRMLMLNFGVVPRSQFTRIPPTKRVKVSFDRWQLVVSGQQARTLALVLELRLARKQADIIRYRECVFRDSDKVPGYASALVADAWKVRKVLRWRKHPRIVCRSTANGTNSHEPNKIAERARKGLPLAYSTLKDFIAYWEANESERNQGIEDVRAICADNYFWTKPKSIEKIGRTDTVDFVIPETNTFIGNGFVSKQTPEALNWGFDLAEGDLAHRYDVGITQASTLENKALPGDYVRRLLAAFDEKTALAYVHGLFVNLTEGMVYHGFDRNENVVDLDMPQGAKIGVGMDFNVNPMAAVVFWCIEKGKNRHIHYFDEIELPNSDTQEMCELLRAKYGQAGLTSPHSALDDNDIVMTTTNLDDIYPDSNAGRSTASPGGKTDYDFIREAGFIVHKRASGNPNLRDRYNTQNGLLKPRGGRVRMTIAKRCKKLVKYNMLYSHELKNKDAQKAMSHLLDARDYPAFELFPSDRQAIKLSRIQGF